MRPTLSLLLIASLIACGDGNGDGSVGSLPGSKPLAELDEQGSIELCQGLRDRIRNDAAARRGSCLVSAAIAASITTFGPSDVDPLAICEEELDRCLTAEEEPCEPQAFSATCEATVADFARCFDRAADAIAGFADLGCEEATRDGGLPDPIESSDALRSCDRELEGCFQDECCDAADSCNYADDDFCDCPEQSWDDADCALSR